MTGTDQAFLDRLFETFRLEAAEHIKALSSGVTQLESASEAARQDVLETIFREAHSLKGAARSVNAADIESVCQALESVFDALKRNEVAVSHTLMDALHGSVDALADLLMVGKPNAESSSEVAKWIVRLRQSLHQPSRPANPTTSQDRPAPPLPSRQKPGNRAAPVETLRVPTGKLDSLLRKGEEFVGVKLVATQRAEDMKNVYTEFVSWKKRWDQYSYAKTTSRVTSMQSKRTRSDDFAERSARSLVQIEEKLAVLSRSALQDHHSMGMAVDEFLAELKALMMLPTSTLLEVFPKLVRELAQQQGKEAELVIEQHDIYMDRRILDEMKDPLIHLVRNCVDHGIEDPTERIRHGKRSRGKIRIAVLPLDSNQVEIVVADDGRGLDLERVRSAAVKLGVLPAQTSAQAEPERVSSLIFHSGLSTSPIVTDFSGRGLGLAIVREKVQKLGGTLAVQSEPGAGTTFRITLPLTLTTFRGVLVQSAQQSFVFPLIQLERVLRVRPQDIKRVENRETIGWDGHAVALARLDTVLQLTRIPDAPVTEFNSVLIVVAAGERIAFAVDAILEECEVLVKPVGRELAKVKNIASAALLPSGQVIPILNLHQLMTSAVTAEEGRAIAKTTNASPKSILVVEDSITSRTLLKAILEGAGYKVQTAVDGVDGFTALRSGDFDAVVSDVEMPRMNGFELTARIRADKKLADLSVVLVTSLESREDRERGIEVGADAYIVKSSFDQSNLLDVVGRLV